MKIALSGEPISTGIYDSDEILLGFDRMTDNEIMYTMEKTPNQQFMGTKLNEYMKMRKGRAIPLMNAIKRRCRWYPRWPMWARCATGILVTPMSVNAHPMCHHYPYHYPWPYCRPWWYKKKPMQLKPVLAKKVAEQQKKQQLSDIRTKRADLMKKKGKRIATAKKALALT